MFPSSTVNVSVDYTSTLKSLFTPRRRHSGLQRILFTWPVAMARNASASDECNFDLMTLSGNSLANR